MSVPGIMFCLCRNDDSAIYEAIPSSVAHNTIQGNGNSMNRIINTSSPMASPMAVGAEPPPYSSLGVASPLPLSSGGGHPHIPAASLPITDQESEENYSKVEYSVPFTPTQERAGSQRKPDGIQLSRNESYGSLPTAPPPHYATPTSTLRLIPETQANTQIQNTDTAAMDTDEYEPMMPIPGTPILH